MPSIPKSLLRAPLKDVYLQMLKYINILIYLFIYLYVCVCIDMYVHIHIYIYIQT